MDWLLILGILAFGGLIIGWMGYTTITDSLIKDQKREIRKLENENRKLKAAIRGLENIKTMHNKLYYASPEKPNIEIVRHADRHSTTSGNDELFGEW